MTSTGGDVSSYRLGLAARTLRRGGVVAYPTEGVWGLGCDPWNRDAVDRLLALKGRAAARGLIVIGADLDAVAPFLGELPAARRRTVTADWPGPATWITPAAPGVPAWLTGGREGVALRVTAHPPAAALCRAFGGAIVSTSANPTGRRPAAHATAVRLYFGRRLDGLLPGRTGGLRRPTPIRDARSGAWLRS